MCKFNNEEQTTPTLAVCPVRFAWLVSHQPTVLFSHNKSAVSNQAAVRFSQNKPTPAINHQSNEHACGYYTSLSAQSNCTVIKL
jgi:hypothetical protein